MTTDPKEAAKQFVQDISKKIPLQYKHDQFMIGSLTRLRDQMNEANATINSKVEALLAKSDENKEVQDQLASVLRISLESGNKDGVTELQKMLSSRANIDTQLQALLGIVQYSIMLAGRIEVFRNIMQIVVDAGAQELKDEDLRTKMLNFGPQLQYVWQKAFHECRSMDERQMLSKTIFGKEIKLNNES
jgi:hypothetical protein